jgi:protein SCO1/2
LGALGQHPQRSRLDQVLEGGAMSARMTRWMRGRLRLPLGAALLCMGLSAPPAWPQALQLPAPPKVVFQPRAGARVPLDTVLRDETGTAAPLGSQFGRRPVLLVPVYYSCRTLCSTLFEGVLQALALSGLHAGEYRLVGISVDPHDGPARAAEKARLYAAMLPGARADLAMLTGDAPALARVEAALGYRAVPDPNSPELAHAAGFVVADAEGRVTRFFDGVAFDPAALRAAVRDAGAGKVDAASFTDRIVLLCAHFAPSSGLHNGAAMAAVRAAALLVLLALGGWIWRRRGRGALS